SALAAVLVLFLLVGCAKKMSEKEYYDLAMQSMNQEKMEQARDYFQKILDEYPNGVFSSEALFMVAFIDANYLKNYAEARRYYEEFLQKYPNHELASSARYELEHLGKPVEELPFLKGDSTAKAPNNSQSAASASE
ncbi:MAG: outer membrane protein assembly factor BamD, partial [Calditrichaeota bacterium]